MNPPIRSQADRSALRHALSVGDCDFMSTDHAPHEAEVKTSNFKISAFGTTGLETSLRVLIELWRIGQLTSTRLVQIWSTSPAKFLGIDQDFGCIAVGRKFNAVLCDVWAPSTLIMPGDLVGLSKNNCFIGQRLPGCLKATILGTNVHSLDGVLAS
jgi:dihydroorotase